MRVRLAHGPPHAERRLSSTRYACSTSTKHAASLPHLRDLAIVGGETTQYLVDAIAKGYANGFPRLASFNAFTPGTEDAPVTGDPIVLRDPTGPANPVTNIDPDGRQAIPFLPGIDDVLGGLGNTVGGRVDDIGDLMKGIGQGLSWLGRNAGLLGRFAGRAIPWVGWGVTAWELGNLAVGVLTALTGDTYRARDEAGAGGSYVPPQSAAPAVAAPSVVAAFTQVTRAVTQAVQAPQAAVASYAADADTAGSCGPTGTLVSCMAEILTSPIGGPAAAPRTAESRRRRVHRPVAVPCRNPGARIPACGTPQPVRSGWSNG